MPLPQPSMLARQELPDTCHMCMQLVLNRWHREVSSDSFKANMGFPQAN